MDFDDELNKGIDRVLGKTGAIPGVEVLHAIPGSPSARAGVRVGDRIIGIDDRAVSSLKDVLEILAQPGRDRVYDVIRGNTHLRFIVRFSDDQ